MKMDRQISRKIVSGCSGQKSTGGRQLSMKTVLQEEKLHLINNTASRLYTLEFLSLLSTPPSFSGMLVN